MNIKYPSRGSTFTPGFRNVIEQQRDLLDQGDAVAIDIETTYPGYPGDILVTISADDSSHFETSWSNQDPTRFPARVKGAAHALFLEGLEGSFMITHAEGHLTIGRTAPASQTWWVNHKQTHRQELDGGYVWSPKANRNGSRNQTYDNLTKTAVGDTVYSYANGELRAIGIVVRPHEEVERPREFGVAGEQWDASGWMVRVNWTRLKAPLRPKDHIARIVPLLPNRYSPLQANGNGNQGCYLANISVDLHHMLLRIVQAANPEVRHQLSYSKDEAEEHLLTKKGTFSTETEQLVKARRGQGLFRSEVVRIEGKCRVTGVSDLSLLVASHIKPWRDSNNEEKLDGHNGLLVSPHVDKLFDQGKITFADDGRILAKDGDVEVVMRRWGIDPACNVGSFKEKQRQYLRYHRERVFDQSA